MQLEEKLERYQALLVKWQKAVNLVGPSTLLDAKRRHFDDSLQLVDLLPAGVKVLYDLGSGAGFPGLVLAMARPDLVVHLLESDQKKGQFLKTVSRETDTPVTVHSVRIEASALPAPDIITARALAALEKLLQWAEPWWSVNPDILLVFPKGENWRAEIDEARKNFDFSQTVVQSNVDPQSKILVLSDVRRLAV